MSALVPRKCLLRKCLATANPVYSAPGNIFEGEKTLRELTKKQQRKTSLKESRNNRALNNLIMGGVIH